MLIKKKVIYSLVGWALFISSTIYIGYNLLGRLILSLQNLSAFNLLEIDKKRFLTAFIFFFIGVYFMYKAREKS